MQIQTEQGFQAQQIGLVLVLGLLDRSLELLIAQLAGQHFHLRGKPTLILGLHLLVLLQRQLKMHLLYLDVLCFHQEVVIQFGHISLNLSLGLRIGHLLDLVAEVVGVHLVFHCGVEC
ncbi:hypothetical protein SDC9_114758 [bioreactor metagenome]|uniref:Uncharacterized protein n=1 Tax=bioreactor metagenome TaxID=1076179 RepID=A0A645BXJ4_9ZZZZ